jgi:NADH-quinone oxidoreductase subunit J
VEHHPVNIPFYMAAAVAIAATVMVITRLEAVHALLYLIVSLLSVAIIMFVLGAPFAAALEVIIYAGAIMVLFVFVVMMLNLGPAAVAQERQWVRPRMWIGPSILAGILTAELIYLLSYPGGALAGTREIPPKAVGSALFGPYLVGVELAAMLLLAGLVGAYHLGRRHVVVRLAEERHGFDTDGTGAVVGRRVVRTGTDRPVSTP